MYEPSIRELAVRGHDVHLSLGRGEALGWRPALENLLSDQPRITWSWLSPSMSTFWSEVAKTIRLWAGYLRYFQPEYDTTPKLKARAEKPVPPKLVRLSNSPFFRRAPNRRRLLAVLRALERALPPVPEIEAQLRTERPDVVLITPLVYLGSSQFEVLRTALAMGLRTVFCVGSWDHLSSKALIRDLPYRVLVWNETQRDEAVRLHGVPPERVVVTGAQCYDQWFDRRPVRSREEFCRRVGLTPDRPFLLYVCSALFWGSPVEAEFVRRWVQSLRASAQPELRSVAVLIRPHPARMDEWKTIDLSPFENVTLYGSNPVDGASKNDYFESLFYSSAVVGLNTSAFLEGAVVGRPVHTILLPEFHENQEGTLHFRYLFKVGGGVLQGGRSFEEHCAQLEASLRQRADQPGTNPQFVREFIRPHGLDQPATSIFCDTIDDLLRMPAPAPEGTPFRFLLLRWAMSPMLLLLRQGYGADVIRDDWSRKEREHQRRRSVRARARRARQEVVERVHDERRQRHTTKLAARETAVRASEAERQSVKVEKARRNRDRERYKAGRTRQRARAALRVRVKQTAYRWFDRWRPGRQTT